MVLSYGFQYFCTPNYHIVSNSPSQNIKLGEMVTLMCKADSYWEWCRSVFFTIISVHDNNNRMLPSLLTDCPLFLPDGFTCPITVSGNGLVLIMVWGRQGAIWRGWRGLATIQSLSVGLVLQSAMGIRGSGSANWRNIIVAFHGGESIYFQF